MSHLTKPTSSQLMLASSSLAEEEHTWRHLFWAESKTLRRWSAELTWTAENDMMIQLQQAIPRIASFAGLYILLQLIKLALLTIVQTCVLLHCAKWNYKGNMGKKMFNEPLYEIMIMVIVSCIFVCGLTYGPDGCSDGTQGHQHHTHSNHTAGSQHTGQRDSPAPYRHTYTQAHIGLCRFYINRGTHTIPKQLARCVNISQNLAVKILKHFNPSLILTNRYYF